MKTTNKLAKRINANYIVRLPKHLINEIEVCSYDGNKEHLLCICDIIYQGGTYTRNDKESFNRVSKSSFSEIIKNKTTLNKAIKFLEDNTIIDVDHNYSKDLKLSKGYRVNINLQGGKILDKLIIDKALVKNRMAKLVEFYDKIEYGIQFSKSKYIKEFNINKEAALSDLDKNTYEDLCLVEDINEDMANRLVYGMPTTLDRIYLMNGNSKYQVENILRNSQNHMTLINNIVDGKLYFSRCDVNGRLNSNLTNLPTYLRKHIIGADNLYNIDIKNSQPLFLYASLIKDGGIPIDGDIAKYGELVTEGKLYEYIQDMYFEHKGKVIDRLQAKNMCFKIFYSKVDSYQPFKEFFGMLFPTLMEYINTKNSKSNSKLAIEMQKSESEFIIDSMVKKELKNVGINPFTIHDSFVVNKEEVELTMELIKETFKTKFGVVPQLHNDLLINE